MAVQDHLKKANRQAAALLAAVSVTALLGSFLLVSFFGGPVYLGDYWPALACFIAVIFMFVAGLMIYQKPTGEEKRHLFVRHIESRDWAHFPPGKHPQVPFRGVQFTVIPFDYKSQVFREERHVSFTKLTLAATFTIYPKLDELNFWFDNDQQQTLIHARNECARAAYTEAARMLAARVTDPDDPQFAPWSKELFRLIEERGRERWGDLLDREISFNPPDLSGRGIQVAKCSFTLTREPEPDPEPDEPWEEYDELHIGVHRNRVGEDTQIFLDDDDRVAHMQAIGGSRYGKTKLIEYAARQLIYRGRESVIVLDPNEQFYQSLLSWCAYREFNASYLDPSDEHSQLGFNPFILDDPTPAKIAARAKRLLETTLKAVGVTGEAAQAQRILKCLYYVVIEQGLPITDLNAFFTPRLFDRRDQIMAACQNEEIRDQWEMIAAGKKIDAYVAMMQSSANRLFDLIADPGVRQLFDAPHVINLKSIVDEGDVLIVNLARSPVLSVASRNVIGAFLVDEVWDILSTRNREQAKKLAPCNLIVDEFHNFSTPQFAEMLKEGAKYGLHLWLINHSLEDVEPVVRRALNACHSRFLFGGTSQKDAAAILAGTIPAHDEQLKDEIASITGLRKRVFMLTRTGKQNLWCSTPEVQEFELAPEKRDQYLAEQTRFPEDVQEEPAPRPEPKPIFPKPEQAEQKVEQPKLPREQSPTPATEPDDFYY